ncbi:MAG TPA: hypothetical protein VGC79_22540, partial [Polyangiaceae bacterium]
DAQNLCDRQRRFGHYRRIRSSATSRKGFRISAGNVDGLRSVSPVAPSFSRNGNLREVSPRIHGKVHGRAWLLVLPLRGDHDHARRAIVRQPVSSVVSDPKQRCRKLQAMARARTSSQSSRRPGGASDKRARIPRVLTEDYEIALSLEDFVLDDGDEKGTAGYLINPLQFARIERATRLLVVNCHYVLPKRP